MDVSGGRGAQHARWQLASLVASSADAIVGATVDGVITTWNPGAQQLFGYAPEEIIGRHVSILEPPAAIADPRDWVQRVAADGGAQRSQTQWRRSDGTLVDVLVAVSSWTDDAGEVSGIVVHAHDITQRITAQRAVEGSERRLAEAQRIAQMGSFERDSVTGEMMLSDECYRILGLPVQLAARADVLLAAVHEDDRAMIAEEWAAAVERGIGFDSVLRIVRPDGDQRWVNARVVVDVADDGTIARVVGTLRDNTDRVQALRVQREAEKRFEIAFEQAASVPASSTSTASLSGSTRPAARCSGGRRISSSGAGGTSIHHPDEAADRACHPGPWRAGQRHLQRRAAVRATRRHRSSGPSFS